MGEYLQQPRFAQTCLAEARLQTFSEADPYQRGMLLAAALSEGDQPEDVHVYDTYSQIGTETGNDPDVAYPLAQKLLLGTHLVEALARVERFDLAYKITQHLWTLDEYSGVEASCTLLQSGYSGPEQELLRLFTPASLTEAVDFRARRFHVDLYLEALAAYGVDFSQPEADHATLLAILPLSDIDPLKRQQRLKRLTIAYAQNGRHLPRALALQAAITDHALRIRALLEIAQQTNDPELLATLAEKVSQLADYAVVCKGACGSRFCDHTTDGREFYLGLAHIHARLGDFGFARRLLAAHDDGYHFSEERLRTYLEIYKVEGGEPERNKVLHLLNQVTHYRSTYLSGTIKEIAVADIRHGRTLPSLEAADETVPLLVWEIQSVYGKKSDFEKKMTDADYDTPAVSLARDFFGGDNNFEAYREKRRHAHQSAALGTLAVVLAETGALESARSTLARVTKPTDQVRAKTAVARVCGVL